jgi:hypothetical protein
VDDAVAVSGGEGVGDRDRPVEDLLQGKTARLDLLRERTALDPLHRQEADAVRLLEAVERDDVGVVEGGDGPRLGLEAGEAVGICRDLAHPSNPEETPHLVGAKTGPGGECHVGTAGTILSLTRTDDLRRERRLPSGSRSG